MHYISIKKRLCLLCVGLFSLVSVSAQVDTINYHSLSGVEVTAKGRRSATREATPLQIINKINIERLGIQDLSEAVKHFSGVTVQDYGGIGGLKTVSIRSLGAKHTAVSYDGVAITDAQSGQVDISRFSLDNVNAISLSIGQADDIFQTARMYSSAGALNIQTAAPEFKMKTFNLFSKMKTGSFGLYNPVVRYEQQLGKRWSASVYSDWTKANGEYEFTFINGKEKTVGTRYNSDVNALRLEGNLFGSFKNGGTLRTKIYYYDSERGLPGAVIFYNTNATERLWDNNFFTQLNYESLLTNDLSFRANAKYDYSFSRYRELGKQYSGGEQIDLNTQNEYYGSTGLLYRPWLYTSFSINTDLSYNTLTNNFMNAPTPRRWSSLTAVSLQYKSSSLTATASILGTYITDKVKNGDRPADRKRLSPALSLSWKPFDRVPFRIRASYKDIFRVPTFADLYYLRMGNTLLKPEKATQYNLGFTWENKPAKLFTSFSLSADAYYNKVRDKIVAIPSMYIWKMMNMGRVDIKGMDINLNAEIPLENKMSVIMTTAYSYQHAVDITDPTEKNYNDQIPYTPRHSGSASITCENSWVNVSYSVVASGKRYALPQNIKSNQIDSYMEHNFSANRSFVLNKCKLRIQGELLNLLNKNYDIIQYYPMPGRSWRLSVSLIY